RSWHSQPQVDQRLLIEHRCTHVRVVSLTGEAFDRLTQHGPPPKNSVFGATARPHAWGARDRKYLPQHLLLCEESDGSHRVELDIRRVCENMSKRNLFFSLTAKFRNHLANFVVQSNDVCFP